MKLPGTLYAFAEAERAKQIKEINAETTMLLTVNNGWLAKELAEHVAEQNRSNSDSLSIKIHRIDRSAENKAFLAISFSTATPYEQWLAGERAR